MTGPSRRGKGSSAGALAGAAALCLALALLVQQRLGINFLDEADRGGDAIRHALGVDPDNVTRARAELPNLHVAPRGTLTGYVRNTAQWGTTWADVDHNGCRTRDDILRRDLTGVTLASKCTVVAGTLADPYTGRTIQYSRDKPNAVQIDHVVPLAEAWRTGARDWDTARRRALANDPEELLAVDGPANERKGDDGPDRWRPQVAYQCEYAVKYVLVKARYGLTAPAAEHQALTSMLATCE